MWQNHHALFPLVDRIDRITVADNLLLHHLIRRAAIRADVGAIGNHYLVPQGLDADFDG